VNPGSQDKVMTAPLHDAPRIVLDSNVVLDWMLFGNPSAGPLAEAIRARTVRWIATPAMRQELEHVLTRSRFGRWPVSPSGIFEAWDAWAEMVQVPSASTPTLRCSDPDDQKFIDLAIEGRAAALISRDKALLRLARRAAQRSLKILSPAAWAIATATQPGR
jgi:putative PIN family toxin of toxin-antitoxin system